MGFWRFSDPYASQGPQTVRGGIKAKNTRGPIGETPWAEAWRKILETHEDHRLSRGRSYARKGQVFDLHVESGGVKAKVQGSRPRPYEVEITIPSFRESDWTILFGILARNLLYTAKLLAGQPSMEMFGLLKKAGVGLFPLSKELSFSCTCPDYGDPCKHGAAVFYLIAERLDEDPLLLFLLRGKERASVLQALQKSAHEEYTGPPPVREPLPLDPVLFWGSAENSELPTHPLLLPEAGFCVLDALGPFPFWQGEREIVEVLRPLYQTCQEVGVHLSDGQKAISAVQQEDDDEEMP